MIVIALAAVAAAWAGIASERRWRGNARDAARRTLQVMLYLLVPFVSYVNIAHLTITLSSGVGLGLGMVMLCLVTTLVWAIGKHVLALPRRQLGAVMCSVAIVNTGYLGNPIISALLGSHALHFGVAWDQLISGPALFVLGFGIGATYGDGERPSIIGRLRVFLLRNPPLWASVAGLIVPPSLAPAPLPGIAEIVVDAMLVGGFFSAGVYLSSERREDHAPLLARPDAPTLLIIAGRLLMAPLLLLGLSGAIVSVPTAYLVQSIMPTGLSSLIVGNAYGLDQRLIATAILWGSAIVIVAALVLGVV